VEAYANGYVIASYTEVESGKRDDRPELAKALACAKANKATLLIAKLDRLGRRVSFIFALKDAGVDFIALDCPELNTLMLAVMAGMAQHEREIISARTKAALAAAKQRGVRLGNPQGAAAFGDRRGLNATTTAATEAKREQAKGRHAQIRAMAAGGATREAIARELGISARSVYRVLAKISASPA